MKRNTKPYSFSLCSLGVLATCVFFTGCGGGGLSSDDSAPAFEDTYEQLQSDNWGQRYDAMDTLETWGSEAIVSADQGVQLIELIAGTQGSNFDNDEKETILTVLAQRPHPMYVDPLIGVFDKLPVSCRNLAISIYVQLDMPAASDALVDAAATYENDSNGIEMDGYSIGSQQGHAERALPKLVKYLGHQKYGMSIANALATAHSYGFLDVKILNGKEEELLAQTRKILRKQADGSTTEFNLLFGLLADLPGEASVQFFSSVARDGNYASQTRLLAVSHLLNQQAAIPRQALRQLADDEKTRYGLFELCELYEQPELFPAEWRQLRLLAESKVAKEVYEYETYAEKGVKVSFVATVMVDGSAQKPTEKPTSEKQQYLVYRYGISESEYLYSYVEENSVAVVGPIVSGDTINSESLGFVFLSDDEFQDYTPQEHVKMLLEEYEQ